MSLDKFEKALKDFWKEHKENLPIKGAHTEIVIEPKIFLDEEINPELAKLLVTAYISRTSIPELKRNTELSKNTLIFKDEDGNEVAEISNYNIVKFYKKKLSRKSSG